MVCNSIIYCTFALGNDYTIAPIRALSNRSIRTKLDLGWDIKRGSISFFSQKSAFSI